MSALTDAVAAFEKTVADLTARVEKLEKASTAPVVLPPTTTPTPAPTSKLAGWKLPARGFFDGAAGWGAELDANVAASKFGAWRGDPVDISATWQDSPAAWDWGPTLPVMKYRGVLDLAPGGPQNNWAGAAAGNLDAKWADYLRRVKAARTFDGKTWPTIIRPAHEMNGDWYPWTVRPANVADFKATMKRWRAVLDREFAEAVFALCFNGDTSTWDLDVNQMYEPGVWDLIGVDQYNIWPTITTDAQWNEQLLARKNKNPRGIEAWRLWAKERGLPIYHPEYANGGADTDSVVWPAKRLAWCRSHAGIGPGQFLGGIWFNIARGDYGDAYWLVDDKGTNPKTPKTAAWHRDAYPIV